VGSALLSKKDMYTYYYSNGYSLNIYKKIIPQIGLGLGYKQDKQQTAYVTTDYSFTQKESAYTVNPSINDAFRRELSVYFIIDPNKYRAIDWGDGDITRFKITEYPSLIFKTDNSWRDALGSTFDNRKYLVEIQGSHNFVDRFKPTYTLGARFVNGNVPYQDLGYFEIYTTIISNVVFSNMDYREFYGDKLFYFLIENDFGKIFPASVPLFKSMRFKGYFNAGRSYMSGNALTLNKDKNLPATQGLFMETGFAFTDILDFVAVYFGWRLNNYSDGNNFNWYLVF
jgi:hypothetical protein